MVELHEYEDIFDSDACWPHKVCWRLSVPGGWLYVIETKVDSVGRFAVAAQFVPDPPSGPRKARRRVRVVRHDP